MEALPTSTPASSRKPTPSRSSPSMLARVESFIPRPANLRPLKRAGDLEPQFPAELMGHEAASRLELLPTPFFMKPEHLADGFGSPCHSARCSTCSGRERVHVRLASRDAAGQSNRQE